MDRQAILEYYDVDESGVIQSPGKFEGEMLYAPYYYEVWNSGMQDGDRGASAWFSITAEDRQQFPELPRRKRTIWLSEDSQGFVRVS